MGTRHSLAGAVEHTFQLDIDALAKLAVMPLARSQQRLCFFRSLGLHPPLLGARDEEVAWNVFSLGFGF